MANDFVNFDRLRLSFQFSTNALRFRFFTKEAERLSGRAGTPSSKI